MLRCLLLLPLVQHSVPVPVLALSRDCCTQGLTCGLICSVMFLCDLGLLSGLWGGSGCRVIVLQHCSLSLFPL